MTNIEELELRVKTAWEDFKRVDDEAKALRNVWFDLNQELGKARQEKEVADLVAQELAKMQGCCNE